MLSPGGEIGEERISRLAELLTTVLLTLVMRLELGSVHMEDVIRRALDDHDFMAETVHALLTTILYVELRLPGWPERLRSLRETHGKHPIVAELVRVTALLAYRLDTAVAGDDRQRIERLLVDMHTPTVSGKGSAGQRAAMRDAVVKELREGSPRRQLSGPIGPLDELDDGEAGG